MRRAYRENEHSTSRAFMEIRISVCPPPPPPCHKFRVNGHKSKRPTMTRDWWRGFSLETSCAETRSHAICKRHTVRTLRFRYLPSSRHRRTMPRVLTLDWLFVGSNVTRRPHIFVCWQGGYCYRLRSPFCICSTVFVFTCVQTSVDFCTQIQGMHKKKYCQKKSWC